MQVSDDQRVGTELAGYRIESLLGRGGMSVVYLAEDRRLKRRVALKLLAAGLAERSSRSVSASCASRSWPRRSTIRNIVPIYEAGDDRRTSSSSPCATSRVATCKSALAARPRWTRRARSASLAQVASALDAAHARGLVHRDVKPSNVLLDAGARPDGSDHVYLADFGLTKRVAERPGPATAGTCWARSTTSPPSRSPASEVDGRADVYSLGCVLYECLVGRAAVPPRLGRSRWCSRTSRRSRRRRATRRPELPAGARRRDRQGTGEGAGAALRELPRAGPGGPRGHRRRGEPACSPRSPSRAAAGQRRDLSEVEAELAGKVIDLQLVREQARVLAGPSPRRPAWRAEGVCPFKGLASFEPTDADYFFGRERLIAELVARLVGARLPRHRRPVGQRQVVRPASRSAPGPGRRRPPRQRGAGGGC